MKEIYVSGYKAQIKRIVEEDGGGFLICVPRLPGCFAIAENESDGLEKINDAVPEWLLSAARQKHPIPDSDKFLELTEAFQKNQPILVTKNVGAWESFVATKGKIGRIVAVRPNPHFKPFAVELDEPMVGLNSDVPGAKPGYGVYLTENDLEILNPA